MKTLIKKYHAGTPVESLENDFDSMERERILRNWKQ
jgi:hypothetical protein